MFETYDFKCKLTVPLLALMLSLMMGMIINVVFKMKVDVYPRCFTYLNLTFDILVVEINPTVSCGPHSSEESVILKLKLSINKNPQTKIH